MQDTAVSDGALDGITRRIVLELWRQEEIEAVERSLTPYDVHTAYDSWRKRRPW